MAFKNSMSILIDDWSCDKKKKTLESPDDVMSKCGQKPETGLEDGLKKLETIYFRLSVENHNSA